MPPILLNYVYMFPPKTHFLPLFLKNSVYEPEYHESHPTIQMFWKAFHKLTLDEKRQFLCKYYSNRKIYKYISFKKINILFVVDQEC